MANNHVVHIIKLPVTWILVADARRGQVYTRRKVERLVPQADAKGQATHTVEPVPLPEMAWQAEPLSQYDIGRNATGMVFESADTSRSMGEPRLDARDEVRGHLARAIATALNRAHGQKAFDRLVLVAPAKMLGDIKQHLNARVLDSVVAEMPKELTHCDTYELADHLRGVEYAGRAVAA